VGSIGGGHYTACAKVAGEGGGEGGKWVSFDDRWVEEMEGGREGGREGGNLLLCRTLGMRVLCLIVTFVSGGTPRESVGFPEGKEGGKHAW
jgi:hypothetical protein